MGEMTSTFDDFVGALQETNGHDVLVEVIQNDDGHTVAELHGRLGAVVLSEDWTNSRRGVGWFPVGIQPRVGRGTGFCVDSDRFRGAEVSDFRFRGRFDDLIYVITPGQTVG